MDNINKNILNAVIFGIIKHISDNGICLIECNINQIDKSYNKALFYIQYDYLVNANIISLSIIKIIDDIVSNEIFLERLKSLIQNNYSCYIPDSVFQEVIQEVISVLKSEIQSTKI